MSVAYCIVLLAFPDPPGRRYRKAAAHPAANKTMSLPEGQIQVLRNGNRHVCKIMGIKKAHAICAEQ